MSGIEENPIEKSIKENDNDNSNVKNNDDEIFCKPKLPDPFLAPPPPTLIKTPKTTTTATNQQQLLQKLDYTEPTWSSKPSNNDNYYLECIKNGTQIDNFDLNSKSYYSIGRYTTCDLMLEHPSLSRFHAILQYSNGEIDVNYQKGFYIFDLNSTHGTIVNKQKIESKKYIYLKIGSCIKFGGSSRLFILNGPELPNSDDLNINLTHEQMKKFREKQTKLALKLKIQKEIQEEEEEAKAAAVNIEDNGIDWGLNNDIDNDGIKTGDAAIINNLTVTSDTTTTSDDSYYASDPRKALKIFFEREGEELNYECEELGFGRFKCRIRLPIDNDFGEPVYAEILNFEGKKKDCMAQCALEACHILDSTGILRQSSNEYKRKRIEKDWQSNDFYDSDDDTYLDRTGDIEKKRLKRIDKVNIQKDEDNNNKILTFETLKNDFKKLNEELIDINKKLDKCKNIVNAVQNDDIDAYINYLKQRDNNKLDTVTRTKLKRRVVDITHELIKLDKLLNLAKPGGFDLNKWKIDLVNEIKNFNNKNDKVEENKTNLANNEVVKPVNIVKQVENGKSDEKNVDSESVKETKNQMKIAKAEVSKKRPVEVKETEEEMEESDNVDNEKKSKSYDKFINNSDYSMWLPPDNQSGDGKTKLNEKFGY